MYIYISLYVYDLLSVIYNRETIIYYIYYLYCIFSIFYYQNNLLHHGFTYYVVNYLVVATIHLLSKTSCIFQMNVFFPGSLPAFTSWRSRQGLAAQIHRSGARCGGLWAPRVGEAFDPWPPGDDQLLEPAQTLGNVVKNIVVSPIVFQKHQPKANCWTNLWGLVSNGGQWGYTQHHWDIPYVYVVSIFRYFEWVSLILLTHMDNENWRFNHERMWIWWKPWGCNMRIFKLFFPVLLLASAVWGKRSRAKCLPARNIPGHYSISKCRLSFKQR